MTFSPVLAAARMTSRLGILAAFLALVCASLPAVAQNAAPAAKATEGKGKKGSGAPFAGFGGNSKEPIKIDSNKLEVFDKENRAVYSGDVVVVQGQSTVRSPNMTVHYTSSKGGGQTTTGASAASQSSIRKIDFDGPVSIISGTQSATANFMTYDASSAANARSMMSKPDERPSPVAVCRAFSRRAATTRKRPVANAARRTSAIVHIGEIQFPLFSGMF